MLATLPPELIDIISSYLTMGSLRSVSRFFFTNSVKDLLYHNMHYGPYKLQVVKNNNAGNSERITTLSTMPTANILQPTRWLGRLGFTIYYKRSINNESQCHSHFHPHLLPAYFDVVQDTQTANFFECAVNDNMIWINTEGNASGLLSQNQKNFLSHFLALTREARLMQVILKNYFKNITSQNVNHQLIYYHLSKENYFQAFSGLLLLGSKQVVTLTAENFRNLMEFLWAFPPDICDQTKLFSLIVNKIEPEDAAHFYFSPKDIENFVFQKNLSLWMLLLKIKHRFRAREDALEHIIKGYCTLLRQEQKELGLLKITREENFMPAKFGKMFLLFSVAVLSTSALTLFFHSLTVNKFLYVAPLFATLCIYASMILDAQYILARFLQANTYESNHLYIPLYNAAAFPSSYSYHDLRTWVRNHPYQARSHLFLITAPLYFYFGGLYAIQLTQSSAYFFMNQVVFSLSTSYGEKMMRTVINNKLFDANVSDNHIDLATREKLPPRIITTLQYFKTRRPAPTTTSAATFNPVSALA